MCGRVADVPFAWLLHLFAASRWGIAGSWRPTLAGTDAAAAANDDDDDEDEGVDIDGCTGALGRQLSIDVILMSPSAAFEAAMAATMADWTGWLDR